MPQQLRQYEAATACTTWSLRCRRFAPTQGDVPSVHDALSPNRRSEPCAEPSWRPALGSTRRSGARRASVRAPSSSCRPLHGGSRPTSRARPTHHLEMCRVSSTGCLSRSGKTIIQRSASASRKAACSPPASSSSLEPRARSAGARSSVGPLLGSPTPQAACPPTRSLARPVVGGPSSNCSGRSPPLGYRRLDDAPPAREGTREIKRSESPPPPSPSGLMIK